MVHSELVDSVSQEYTEVAGGWVCLGQGVHLVDNRVQCGGLTRGVFPAGQPILMLLSEEKGVAKSSLTHTLSFFPGEDCMVSTCLYWSPFITIMSIYILLGSLQENYGIIIFDRQGMEIQKDAFICPKSQYHKNDK